MVRYLWSRILLLVTSLCFSAASKSTRNGDHQAIKVLDVGGTLDADPALQISVLSCIGLFNRNESIAGAAFPVWYQYDLDWLAAIEHIQDPTYTKTWDFLVECLTTVARGRYIAYKFRPQQKLVPNIITLAGVLDAIPLTMDSNITTALLAKVTNATMVLDAEKEFDGFSAYDATKYVYENYANLTTTLCKLDPGYDFSHPHLDPPCNGHPASGSVDYVVKERLFNFYLVEGCIAHTKENALVAEMTQHDNPKTKQWPQPIAVLGYDDVHIGHSFDPWEAQTSCVKNHNMGGVCTDWATGLSFWSRKAPIQKPLVQPYTPPQVYNDSTTYIALVVGDGDNVGMMKTRNLDWTRKRVSYCRNATMPHNCFPISWTISPHLLHFAPDIVQYYFGQNTTQDFFLLPPSGYLYAYPTMFQEDDQASFVAKTEHVAHLLNTSGTVDWEWPLGWKKAISHYFPRYAARSMVRGFFGVNVPFNAPNFEFGRNEFYKLLHPKATEGSSDDGGTVVLFRPREWRGSSGKGDVPFSKKNNLLPKDMAAEVNGYPKGTVCYIYLTSDGGNDIDSLYNMVPFLDSHVQVVSHETAIDMALQRGAKREETHPQNNDLSGGVESLAEDF